MDLENDRFLLCDDSTNYVFTLILVDFIETIFIETDRKFSYLAVRNNF